MTSRARVCAVRAQEFDFLITVKVLEESDELEKVLNPHSKIVKKALGEPSLRALNKGDKIQLERMVKRVCARVSCCA
jgi:hypothetical protein